MNWLDRLAKPCKWVRRYKCSNCGKCHEVIGRRSQLNDLQEKQEADCANGVKVQTHRSGFIQ